jgi:hypothetical protein
VQAIMQNGTRLSLLSVSVSFQPDGQRIYTFSFCHSEQTETGGADTLLSVSTYHADASLLDLVLDEIQRSSLPHNYRTVKQLITDIVHEFSTN